MKTTGTGKNMKIKSISLHQPWASLVALGEKHVETRSWQWPGDMPDFVAIHAAKKWGANLATMTRQEPFRSVLALHGIDSIPRYCGPNTGGLPFGAIVAVVRIVECVSTTYLPPRPYAVKSLTSTYLQHCQNERSFGDYSIGRYAWAFDRFLRLDEPVPCVGRQGVFYWEAPDIIAKWVESASIAT